MTERRGFRQGGGNNERTQRSDSQRIHETPLTYRSQMSHAQRQERYNAALEYARHLERTGQIYPPPGYNGPAQQTDTQQTPQQVPDSSSTPGQASSYGDHLRDPRGYNQPDAASSPFTTEQQNIQQPHTTQQNQENYGIKRKSRSPSDAPRLHEETKRTRSEIPFGTYSPFGPAVREAMIQANTELPQPETFLPEYVTEVLQQFEDSSITRNQEVEQDSSKVYRKKLDELRSKRDGNRVPYLSTALRYQGIRGLIKAQQKSAEENDDYVKDLKSVEQSIQNMENKIKNKGNKTNWSTSDIETLKSLRRDLDKVKHSREPLDDLKKFLDRRD